MVRNFLALLVLASLVACGGDDAAPVADSTPAAVQQAPDTGKADLAKQATKSNAKDGSDVLAQTRKLDPGDLAIVFSNNVDGEIEPCG